MHNPIKISLQKELYDAIYHEAWDKVLIAALSGADLNSSVGNSLGCLLPLHSAIHCGRMDIANALIKLGANVNEVPHNSNRRVAPLHIAVECNNLDAITQLLRAGANVNVPDGNGQTALHYAIEQESPKQFVALLLKAGANARLQDASGKTVLDYAEELGLSSIVNTLACSKNQRQDSDMSGSKSSQIKARRKQAQSANR